MRKPLFVSLTLLFFITGGYAFWATSYVWSLLPASSIGKVIETGTNVKDHLSALVKGQPIPEWLFRKTIRWYISSGNYDVNGTEGEIKVPLLYFTLFPRDFKNEMYDEQIFDVAQLLLNRGADVNAIVAKTGRTALHEAILFNFPRVVDFLIKNKADPTIKINNPNSGLHDLDALSFAQKLKTAKNENYTEVIGKIERYYTHYNNRFKKPRGIFNK